MVFMAKAMLLDASFKAQLAPKALPIASDIIPSFANPLPTSPLSSVTFPLAFALEMIDLAPPLPPAPTVCAPPPIDLAPPNEPSPPPVEETSGLLGGDNGLRVADEPVPAPSPSEAVIAEPLSDLPSAVQSAIDYAAGRVTTDPAHQPATPQAETRLADLINTGILPETANVPTTLLAPSAPLQELTVDTPVWFDAAPPPPPPAPYDPTAGAPVITGPDLFAITVTGIGSGIIDIANNYQLWFNEVQSEIVIRNLIANESTRIWGESVCADRDDLPLQFWGTSSFELLDGTKVTVETKPMADNQNLYTLDKVTVTNDRRAVILTGLDNATLNDVKIDQSNSGWDIEDDTRDGFTLVENETGAGWNNEYPGTVVVQKDLDETAIGERFAPGSSAISLGELRVIVSRFLTSSITTSFISATLSHAAPNHNQRSSNDEDRNAAARHAAEKHALLQKIAEREFHKLAIIQHKHAQQG
jgi:hypothetical protein